MKESKPRKGASKIRATCAPQRHELDNFEIHRETAQRRMLEIYAGRHPDTGQPLKAEDETIFRPGEVVALQILLSLRGLGEMHPDVSNLLEAYVFALDRNSDLFGFEKLKLNEILARIGPYTKPLGSFDAYDVAAVEFARRIFRQIAKDMEAEFVQTKNPIFVWWALRMIHTARLAVPRWIARYLGSAAEIISRVSDEVQAGRPVGMEAERVGKALGFGTEGPGAGGWFKQLEMLERDRKIHEEVGGELRKGEKLDFAYDTVAKRMGLSRSTVQRGYARIMRFTTENSDPAGKLAD